MMSQGLCLCLPKLLVLPFSLLVLLKLAAILLGLTSVPCIIWMTVVCPCLTVLSKTLDIHSNLIELNHISMLELITVARVMRQMCCFANSPSFVPPLQQWWVDIASPEAHESPLPEENWELLKVCGRKGNFTGSQQVSSHPPLCCYCKGISMTFRCFM